LEDKTKDSVGDSEELYNLLPILLQALEEAFSETIVQYTGYSTTTQFVIHLNSLVIPRSELRGLCTVTTQYSQVIMIMFEIKGQYTQLFLNLGLHLQQFDIVTINLDLTTQPITYIYCAHHRKYHSLFSLIFYTHILFISLSSYTLN